MLSLKVQRHKRAGPMAVFLHNPLYWRAMLRRRQVWTWRSCLLRFISWGMWSSDTLACSLWRANIFIRFDSCRAFTKARIILLITALFIFSISDFIVVVYQLYFITLFFRSEFWGRLLIVEYNQFWLISFSFPVPPWRYSCSLEGKRSMAWIMESSYTRNPPARSILWDRYFLGRRPCHWNFRRLKHRSMGSYDDWWTRRGIVWQPECLRVERYNLYIIPCLQWNLHLYDPMESLVGHVNYPARVVRSNLLDFTRKYISSTKH